jgi:hypothetical protein
VAKSLAANERRNEEFYFASEPLQTATIFSIRLAARSIAPRGLLNLRAKPCFALR